MKGVHMNKGPHPWFNQEAALAKRWDGAGKAPGTR